MVVVYTADQPNQKKESQYVAYGNDGGMTFTNYEHNPVIDLHKKDFRDPGNGLRLVQQPSSVITGNRAALAGPLPACSILRSLKVWDLSKIRSPSSADIVEITRQVEGISRPFLGILRPFDYITNAQTPLP